MTDGGNVTGSTNTTLFVANVSPATSGAYQVVISNFYGVVTSTVATLTLAPPATAAYDVAVEAAQPVAYWRLNDTVRPNPGPAFAYDFYGGFAGTYAVNASNAANGVLGPVAPAFPGFETNNGALETVDGETNSFVTVPALNLNTNVVSISMWIYPLGNQNPNTGLFFWRGGNTGGLIYNGAHADNDLGYNWGSSALPYLWDSQLSPPSNLWSFVTLEVTPTNATLYMLNTNGRASASIALTNPVLAFDSASTIGTDPYQDNRTFNGIIDEVALYRQTFTESQLDAMYVAGAGPWLQFEPIITQQPDSATLYPGRTAQFTVAATGLTPFSYQWYATNGAGGFTALAATNATLLVNNVSTNTPTEFEVVITNSYGSATSLMASLTVVNASLSGYATAVQSNQPVAFWQLNETNVNPATGNAPAFDYDGGFTGLYGSNTFNGASPTPYTVVGPTPPALTGFPVNNGAVETFTGSNNSYVTVPPLNLNTNVMSCVMWVNPATAQLANTGLFVCRGGTTVAGFGYANSVPNNLGYNWNNNFSTYNWPSGLSAPAGIWSLVAWVVTPTNLTVYLVNSNGLSSSSLANANQVEAFDSFSTIGSDSFTNVRTFNGDIADVAVFNQALTEIQVASLYSAGTEQTFPPLVILQPNSTTLYAGRTAQFTAGVQSATAFNYQWMTTNGSGGFATVSSGTGAPGVADLTLSLTNVSAATPVTYSLMVSNLYGAVTSSVATLTVVAPGTIDGYQTAVAAAQPLAFWQLNETNLNPASGTAPAYDYYGGYTGTYGVNSFDGGSPSPYTVAGPSAPTFTGFFTNEGALETVAGVNNSYVTVPALYLNTATLTCSMWIDPMGAQASGTGLFFCRGGTTVSGFGYGNIISNTLGYTWNNAPATYNWYSGLTAPSNAWSLVSWVVTPTNATIYVMNTSGTTSANVTTPNPVQAFDAPSAIGSDILTSSRTFNGLISDVALFNQALTQSQLAALYTAGGQTSSGGPTFLPVSLQIQLNGGNTVTLLWSSAAGPYLLKSNSSLAAGTWGTVTNTPTVVSGSNEVVLPLTTNAQFYRLSSQ